MERYELLLGRYEDARFSLLVEDLIAERAKQWTAENERLRHDPDFFLPQHLLENGLKLIRRGRLAGRSRHTAVRLKRAVHKIALVCFLAALLVTVACAVSPTLRTQVRKLVVTITEVTKASNSPGVFDASAEEATYDPSEDESEGGEPVSAVALAQVDWTADSPVQADEGTPDDEISDAGAAVAAEPAPDDSAAGAAQSSVSEEPPQAPAPPDNTPVNAVKPPVSPPDDTDKPAAPPNDDIQEQEVTGKVAAVGQAALLVELLGAGERLCAASADFGENSLAQAAFTDADPALLWSGDGTHPLSDTDFARLLELDPEVCFAVSGDMTFTEIQVQSLESLGITYVVLPAFTSAENIQQAVSLAADVLGDQSDIGGADAPAIAERYLKWYRDTLNELEGAAENSLSTLFIDGWDSAAATEICWSDPYTGVTGDVHWRDSTGTAVVNLKTTDSPLNYFLSVGGVSNRAACSYVGIPQSSNTYYATLESTGNPLTLSVTEPTIYVNPLYPAVGHHVCNIWSLSDAGFSSALFVGDGTFTTNHYTGLGNSGFPALVVSSGSVKAAIESSPSWQVFGASGGLGGFGDYNGFTCPEDGYTVASLIKGSYDIYVNPAGLGDWINGSPESILEAVWAAWKFQGGEDSPYTEAWCREKISDFYSTFYRYDLTDSELDAILAGK